MASTRIVDLSISEDNKYLALAELDTSGAIIKSSIKTISIENASTIADDYIYEENNSKMLVNINYQEKNNLVCVYNDSIDAVNKKEKKQLLEVEDKITFVSGDLKNSICYIKEEKKGIFDSNSVLNIVNTRKRPNILI